MSNWLELLIDSRIFTDVSFSHLFVFDQLGRLRCIFAFLNRVNEIDKFNMRKILIVIFIAVILTGCSEKKIELLDFPNTRQSLDYSCGPSAVQSVLAYYGEDFRESELIGLLKTAKDEGTYIKDIVILPDTRWKLLHRNYNRLKTAEHSCDPLFELVRNPYKLHPPVIHLLHKCSSGEV